jgi:hypothetical protein
VASQKKMGAKCCREDELPHTDVVVAKPLVAESAKPCPPWLDQEDAEVPQESVPWSPRNDSRLDQHVPGNTHLLRDRALAQDGDTDADANESNGDASESPTSLASTTDTATSTTTSTSTEEERAWVLSFGPADSDALRVEFQVMLAKDKVHDAPIGFKVRGRKACGLTVVNVRQNGLLEAWNASHPRKEVQPRDWILSVNGVQGVAESLVTQLTKDAVLDLVVQGRRPRRNLLSWRVDMPRSPLRELGR